MATINAKSLQLGDILITSADNTVSHCGIVADTTSVNTAAGRVNRADRIYHATSRGIKLDDAIGWAGTNVGVYRMRGLRNLTVVAGNGRPGCLRQVGQIEARPVIASRPCGEAI